MTTKLVALVLLCLMTGTAMAQEAKVTPLISKDLAEYPGKEVLMITVEHVPGGSSSIHRHNAHAFVYVLEGSVVMQLKGGKQVTLTSGQTFYEGPADVHLVDRNASSTKPAKFLVFLIKNKGARAGRVTVGYGHQPTLPLLCRHGAQPGSTISPQAAACSDQQGSCR